MKVFFRSLFLVGLLMAGVALAYDFTMDDHYTFEEYMIEFDKEYSQEEFDLRRSIFEARLHDIKSHNTMGTSTYRKGVNHLTDRTEEELKSMLGFKPSPKARLAKIERSKLEGKDATAEMRRKLSVLPDEVDWRKHGAVNPPRNQGQCGSCWTFSGVSAIESALYISTGKLLTLSEQSFVSCTPNTEKCGGTGGCFGATQDILFDYVMEKGFDLEEDYPYVSGNGTNPTCRPRKLRKAIGSIAGYVDVPVNDLEAHMIAVNSQPLAISADASNWHLYHSGVLQFEDCGADIDHAIVLEGYGRDRKTNQEFWLVRNSWGPSWGENGYIRLARSSRCAVDTTPLDGNGCEGGPEKVTVCGTCGVLSSSSYPVGAYLY